MKVVLLDNVRGIGQVGDVKEVSDGYARNFLLARGKARPAGHGAERDIAALMARKREATALARVEAESLKGRMQGISVTVPAAANEKGTLFAAVEPDAVAELLSNALSVRIDPSQVRPTDHLKTVGEHRVTVELPDGLTADVTVIIEPRKR